MTELEALSHGSTVTVMMLGGECAVLPFNAAVTVGKLKDAIKKKLGPEPEKQRLMYKDKELQVRTL